MEAVDTHRGAHLQRVQAYPTAGVDVGVVDRRHKAHLGRFEWVPSCSGRTTEEGTVTISRGRIHRARPRDQGRRFPRP